LKLPHLCQDCQKLGRCVFIPPCLCKKTGPLGTCCGGAETRAWKGCDDDHMGIAAGKALVCYVRCLDAW